MCGIAGIFHRDGRPVAAGLHHWSTTDPVPHERALHDLAALLRANTPAPDPGRAYGVLAGWTDTHPLLAAAARPVANEPSCGCTT